MSDEESPQQEETPLTVGRKLWNARDEKGLDRQSVADQLHLRPGIIAAIEEDNHDALPGELFLKGYVRSYARLLGLDEESLLSDLEGELAPRRQAQESQQEPSPTEVIQQRRERRRRIGNLVALVAAVVLAVWLIYAFGPFVAEQASELTDDTGDAVPEEPAEVNGDEPAEDASLEEEPVPAEPEEADPVDEPQTRAPGLETPVATVTPPPAQEPDSGIESREIEVTEPEQDLVEVSLSIDFDGECWVEVVNGAGERVVVRLATAGDRIDYVGPGPLEVLLGSVNAVTELRFMGEPVDLGAYPAPAGRAQFVLEAETG